FSALEALLAGAVALNAEFFGIGAFSRCRGGFECQKNATPSESRRDEVVVYELDGFIATRSGSHEFARVQEEGYPRPPPPAGIGINLLTKHRFMRQSGIRKTNNRGRPSVIAR
ncbi:hypothetical protein, partial [Cohnella xylanilytica]|uniref:hypothetical protein n=1 Tax=Cohnella xylanilytica TaxID=557555 RepID=UPI001C88AB1E